LTVNNRSIIAKNKQAEINLTSVAKPKINQARNNLFFLYRSRPASRSITVTGSVATLVACSTQNGGNTEKINVETVFFVSFQNKYIATRDETRLIKYPARIGEIIIFVNKNIKTGYPGNKRVS
jgi:hypothetical protein